MKVSIITVTYNSGRTLADTLESVLRQTYTDIELVVVDGLSADNTMEIVRQYEPRFGGRLRYVSEKDRGIYDAMNKGISMATGEVVGILNSDDFFSADNVIERMVREFTDDVDLVYGDVHFVRDSDLKKSIRYYSGRIFRPWMVRWGFFPPHPSLYVRRSIYDQYGYYKADYKISADFEMIARLCYVHRLRYRYIHMDFVTMRMGGASTDSLSSRILGTKEDLQACRELGIKSNKLMIYCKYIIKAFQAVFIRS